MVTQSSNLFKLIAVFAIGILLWNLPKPEPLTYQAWHLFAIFISTIIGIILNPLPIGALAMLSILVAILTKTLTVEETLGGFGSSIAWLVVFAFFISRGFIKTGLGKRIAYFFISKIGKNTLGLSYGLILTEFLLSPMIPSATARGGGIIFPITKALSEEYGKVDKTKSIKNDTGGFLMQVCFQANVLTSCMFLTAMAGNPLIVSLANQIGVELTWNSWAIGAIVPGIINLLVLPLVVYIMHPPSVKAMAEAPMHAKKALKEMGRISRVEIIMLIVFFAMIVLWILDKKIGMDATTTALLGFAILLVTGVLNWSEALNEKGAWDTLAWFATIVMMSSYLTKLGMMSWIGTEIKSYVSSEFIVLSIGLLIISYFYIHYIFASVTTHATVLYPTFAMLLISLGMPKMLTALVLAYLSSLSGGLTHFGISSAPIFFESGYLSTKQWWKIGGAVSIVNLLIWSTVGALWWHFLGWL